MYFRVNLKMKKPTLCCCFTWIVFIELNFTVAFLLIRKTLDDRFAGKVGGGGWGGGDFKKWRDPSNGREHDFEMGGWGLVLLYGLCSYTIRIAKSFSKKIEALISSIRFFSFEIVLYFYKCIIRP